jgi:hypothetical protein
MSAYTVTFDGKNRHFNNEESFLDLVFWLFQRGVVFTIKVAQKYLPQIAKKLNAFLTKAKINLTIESGADPKIVQILSHGILGGSLGGTIGSVGGVFIGKMLLKKVAEQTLKRTILLAVPGTQVLLPALAVYDVISIGSLIGGTLWGAMIGSSSAVALCYWKVTINIDGNNAQNCEMKFQQKNP